MAQYTQDQVNQLLNYLNQLLSTSGYLADPEAQKIAAILSSADKDQLVQWKFIIENSRLKNEDIAKIQSYVESNQSESKFKSNIDSDISVEEIKKIKFKDLDTSKTEKREISQEVKEEPDQADRDLLNLLNEPKKIKKPKNQKLFLEMMVADTLSNKKKKDLDGFNIEEEKARLELLVQSESKEKPKLQEYKIKKPKNKVISKQKPILKKLSPSKVKKPTSNFTKKKEVEKIQKEPKKEISQNLKAMVRNSIPKVVKKLKNDFNASILDFKDFNSQKANKIKSWIENNLNLISEDDFLEIDDFRSFFDLVLYELIRYRDQPKKPKVEKKKVKKQVNISSKEKKIDNEDVVTFSDQPKKVSVDTSKKKKVEKKSKDFEKEILKSAKISKKKLKKSIKKFYKKMKNEFGSDIDKLNDPFSEDGMEASSWIKMNLNILSKNVDDEIKDHLADIVLEKLVEYKNNL